MGRKRIEHLSLNGNTTFSKKWRDVAFQTTIKAEECHKEKIFFSVTLLDRYPKVMTVAARLHSETNVGWY